MTTITLQVMPGKLLRPMFDADMEAVSKWKLGDMVQANVKRPRNYKLLQKWFVMMNVGYDAWEPEAVEHSGLTYQPVKNFERFREEFVQPVEREYKLLEDQVGWDVVFSSVLEVIGEQEGLLALSRALEAEPDAPAPLREAMENYVAGVTRRGFLPMRLYFAVKRYRRWAELNTAATPTRTMKGNMIRVSVTVSSNRSPVNPPAIISTTSGA